MKTQIQHPVTIELPLCKSWLNRALILLAQRGGELEMGKLDQLPRDSRDLISCLKMLYREEVRIHQGRIFFSGRRPKRSLQSPLYVGEGATTFRFLALLCSLFDFPVTLKTHPNLARRNHDCLVVLLEKLGVLTRFSGNDLFLEGSLSKGLSAKKIQHSLNSLDSKTSQTFSGLQLLAPSLGFSFEMPATLVSRPYAEMTNWMLSLTSLPEQAQRDWSAASLFIATLTPNDSYEQTLFFPGLKAKSFQPDEAIAKFFEFKEMGGDPKSVTAGGQLVKSSRVSENIMIDLNLTPDLYAAGVIMGLVQNSGAYLCGVQCLRGKECDRLEATIRLLEASGLAFEHNQRSDSLFVAPAKRSGGTWPKKSARQTFLNELQRTDHRMLMLEAALSSVVGKCDVPYGKNELHAVSKSFPGFYEQWEKLKF